MARAWSGGSRGFLEAAVRARDEPGHVAECAVSAAAGGRAGGGGRGQPTWADWQLVPRRRIGSDRATGPDPCMAAGILELEAAEKPASIYASVPRALWRHAAPRSRTARAGKRYRWARQRRCGSPPVGRTDGGVVLHEEASPAARGSVLREKRPTRGSVQRGKRPAREASRARKRPARGSVPREEASSARKRPLAATPPTAEARAESSHHMHFAEMGLQRWDCRDAVCATGWLGSLWAGLQAAGLQTALPLRPWVWVCRVHGCCMARLGSRPF